MNLQYLSNLLNYLTTGETIYMEHIYDFIHILENIGDSSHANEIKKELKLLILNDDGSLGARRYPTAIIKK